MYYCFSVNINMEMRIIKQKKKYIILRIRVIRQRKKDEGITLGYWRVNRGHRIIHNLLSKLLFSSAPHRASAGTTLLLRPYPTHPTQLSLSLSSLFLSLGSENQNPLLKKKFIFVFPFLFFSFLFVRVRAQKKKRQRGKAFSD